MNRNTDMQVSRRWVVRVAMLLLALPGGSMAAEARVKDDAPPEVRQYLEHAIKNGEPAHERRVGQAKAQVDVAKSELQTIRKAFSKFKAKRIDVKAAEEKLAAAEKHLAEVRSQPPLELAPLDSLDREASIGVLPHGIGISRVVDENRALVYVFIETATTDDGKLFTDNDALSTQIVPSKSPLLLIGIPTHTWTDGDRVPADRFVYRVGTMQTVDDQAIRTLSRVDVLQYLQTPK